MKGIGPVVAIKGLGQYVAFFLLGPMVSLQESCIIIIAAKQMRF